MTCENICLFLVHLALSGLAYSTINNQVSALVMLAKLNSQVIEIRENFEVGLTLKALRRILGDSTTQKDAVFPADLLAMSRFVNSSDFIQISTWVGVIFLYRTMLRKCHIFADEFNDHLLTRSDIEFTDYGMTVKVSSSKTIQYKERSLLLPVCIGGGKLCIVSLLKWYFHQYPTTLNCPISSCFRDSELLKVRYSKALTLMKDWGQQAKLGKNLGMHSMRRGAATLMSLGGMPLEDIKDRGDWKTDVFYKYIAYPMQRKVFIEKKIVHMLSYFT